MSKIWEYFGKGQVIVWDNHMQLTDRIGTDTPLFFEKQVKLPVFWVFLIVFHEY